MRANQFLTDIVTECTITALGDTIYKHSLTLDKYLLTNNISPAFPSYAPWETPTVAINRKQKIYIYVDDKSKKKLIAAKIQTKNKKK